MNDIQKVLKKLSAKDLDAIYYLCYLAYEEGATDSPSICEAARQKYGSKNTATMNGFYGSEVSKIVFKEKENKK